MEEVCIHRDRELFIHTLYDRENDKEAFTC